MSNSYPVAVIDPFNPRAEGAMTPDMYTFPLQTSKIECLFTVSIPPNQQNLDFVIHPNLFATIACSIPYIDDGTLNSSPIQGGYPWFSAYPYGGSTVSSPSSFAEYGIIDPNVLAATYSRYRIVGMGAQVKCVLPPLTQTGQVTSTLIPSTDDFFNFRIGGTYVPVYTAPLSSVVSSSNPANFLYANAATTFPSVSGSTPATNINSLGNVAFPAGNLYPNTTAPAVVNNYNLISPTWPQYLAFYELPGVDTSPVVPGGPYDSGFITNSMVNFPQNTNLTVSDLTLENGQEVALRVTSPEYLGWRNSQNNPGSFTSAGSGAQHRYCYGDKEILDVTSYVTNISAPAGGATGTAYNNQIVGVVDGEFVHQGGWSSLVYRMSNLPLSSTAQAAFTILVVCHIEGVPFISSSSLISGARYPFYRPMLAEQTLQVAAQMPIWKRIGKALWNHVQDNWGSYVNAAQAVSKLAMRL